MPALFLLLLHPLLLLLLLFQPLLTTHAFIPTTSPSSKNNAAVRRRAPATWSTHTPAHAHTPLYSSSSSSSGWRGGPRPDDEEMDLSGDGGVTKRIIRPGFGYKQESPPAHAYCKIAFVMKTAAGQVIADRMKEPMEFMLGLERPEVIPGWELAVASMKPNEIAEITCRAEYAFGASEGYEDKIPPGSTIVTRLQLLDWRSLKGAGSTDVEDTHELTKKWREEIDEGTSPMTEWAAPPGEKEKMKERKGNVVDVDSVGEGRETVVGVSPPPVVPKGPTGPLADAQAEYSMHKQQQKEEEKIDGFSAPSTPRVEAMPDDGPKPIVDIDDTSARQKLNKNQVVIGTAPQYKWKERQGYLELVVPVPEEVRKQDVLVHLTNRVCMVGFKNTEGKENWVCGGDLFGPIELSESFWVLSKDYQDDLTEGKTCIEIRLEKKEPMRRIWSTVFKDQ